MRTVVILGMLAIWACMLISCGGGGAPETNQTVVDKPHAPVDDGTGKHESADEIRAVGSAAANGDEPKTKPTEVTVKRTEVEIDEWADASKAVQQGDVRVSVESASVATVPLKTIGGTGESKDALLQILVRVENLSDSRKLNYRTWMGNALGLGSSARVEDEFGNTYRRISFGFGDNPVGQISRSESIYPQKSITDLLVFEEPIKKATVLKVTLPADVFGGDGVLKLKIPIQSTQRRISSSADETSTSEPESKAELTEEQKAEIERMKKEQEELAKATAAKEKAEAEKQEKDRREKTASSLVIAAKTFLKKGKRSAAKKRLKKVIDTYPETQAADQAEELLNDL